MKGKDLFYAVLALTVLLLLWLFIDERERGKRKDKIIDTLRNENEELKISYLTLFQKYLEKDASIEPSIIEELEKLKSKMDKLDTPTHIELKSVIKQVNNNDGVKAVKDLAKIVENKLKDKAEKENTFKKSKSLANLLDYALDCKWINERMHKNGIFLKDIRNKESHELAVELPTHEIGIAIYGGIDILYRL